MVAFLFSQRGICPRDRRGSLEASFSLVELLTVVTIIAIVASMLLETFAAAEWAAQRTECREAQRQLDIAQVVAEGRWLYEKTSLVRCYQCHPSYP